MMMLDDMRAEFARHLGEQSGTRFSMDKAMAHVVTLAYEKGLADGRAQVQIDELRAVDDSLNLRAMNVRMESLLRRMLDPEDLGYAVRVEVRGAVLDVIGRCHG